MKKQSPKAASEDITRLFVLADAVFSKEPALANRYVYLARKIAMKHKIRLTSAQKRKFCKHCNSYIRSGVNGRIRLRAGKLVMSCFSCKKFSRFVYSR
ncbi:MAG: ribonuclease P [archaeon]